MVAREADPDRAGAVRTMALVGVFVAALAGIANEYEGPRRGYELLAVAAFVATPMLAIRFARTTGHLAMAGALAALAASVGTGGGQPTQGWGRIGIGVLLVVAGGLGHVRRGRLERRLAGLKGSAS